MLQAVPHSRTTLQDLCLKQFLTVGLHFRIFAIFLPGQLFLSVHIFLNGNEIFRLTENESSPHVMESQSIK